MLGDTKFTNARGTISYGPIVFDSLLKTDISSTAIRDDGNRMTKCIEYTLRVTGLVTGGVGQGGVTNDTNTIMKKIRNVLNTDGLTLKYDDKGFGKGFVVNAEGFPDDIAFGPKTKTISFVPLGGPFSALVEWQVVFCLPECSGAVTRKRLSMFNYSCDYDIDKHGFHTITVTGALEIPLTFWNGQKLGDQADNYRDGISFQPPLGFERSQKFRLSMDRRRLEFTFIDRQIPIAPPDSCTAIEMRHKVGNQHSNVFGIWNNVISGSIQTNPSVPKALAWSQFVFVASKRIMQARRTVVPGTNTGTFASGAPAIMLTRLTVDENIFGFDTRFEIAYDIYGLTLDKILQVSGLWLPVDTDWDTWRNSLSDNAQNIRGNLKVRYFASADTLLDLCSGAKPNPPDSGASKSAPDNNTDELTIVANDVMDGGGTVAGGGVGGGSGSFGGSNSNPFDPESSWLAYEASLTVIQDNHIVTHKPLAGTVTVTPSQVDPTNIQNILGSAGELSSSITTDTSDILQRICAPTTTVLLQGRAMRAGYAIAPPELTLFQGQPVVEKRRAITTNTSVGNADGAPIFAISYSILYALLSPVTGPYLPILANPVTQTDGIDGGPSSDPQTIIDSNDGNAY